jgi:hypothetical protein
VSTFDSNWDSGLGAAMSYIYVTISVLADFLSETSRDWQIVIHYLVADKCTSIHKTTIYFISTFHAN